MSPRSHAASRLAAIALAACGARDTAPVTPSGPPGTTPVTAARAPEAPPTWRLPDDVVPRAYDLRLDLDPDRADFVGHVEIAVHLDGTTDAIWLHAAGLVITRARYAAGATTGAMVVGAPGAGDRRRLQLDRAVRGDVTLVLDYTGHVTSGGEQEALFRQQAGGRWYLYSQAEALFARRIVPCFDEPRFKATWKVTLVVPPDDVALGNAPLATTRPLADGRREVALAPIGPLPTYLVAIAVGPFDLVDAGTVGRAKLPLRIAVTHGRGGRAAFAAHATASLVTQIEDELDLAMPWPKLDLVEVPRLFGAMEHTGLITFDSSALLGDAEDPAFTRRFVRVASHELAHQWFGNSVTHAWWDDLWLAEAFASWIADKISTQAGGFDDPVLRHQLSREHAIAADREAGAAPLRRVIHAEPDIELTFDAIAYDKGAAVIAMFEAAVGEPRFRAAMHGYLERHARGTATARDVIDALAQATDAPTAASFGWYLEHAGTPVVDLRATCAPSPILVAHARAGAQVPVCVRYAVAPGPRAAPAAPLRACAIVGDRTEIALAGCPAWFVGNADGAGYYDAAPGPEGLPPIAALTPAERIVAGDDAAAAVRRGELGPADAVKAMRLLGARPDPYAMLGALALVRALDPLVDDRAREAWGRLLARNLASVLTPAALFAPSTPAARAIREQVLELVPAEALPQTTLVRARAILGRLSATTDPSPELELAVAIAAPRDGAALFERVLGVIHATRDRVLAEALVADLGAFGGDLAPRIVEVALAEPTRGRAATEAITRLLGRSAARGPGWHALRDRWPRIVATLPAADTRAILTALGGLCDAASRSEVAAVVGARIHDLDDGPRTLAATLGAIDGCIEMRARFGDLAPALVR